MNRTKKKCKRCGEDRYVFSKGECKPCAQIRYAAKIAENQKQKTAITSRLKPKRSISKVPTKRHQENKEDELENMLSFWEEHADFDGGCGCFECNKYLFFDRTHCAHILSKGAYPQYRSDPRNLVILCLKHHTQLDCGKSTEMKIYPFIEERKTELKIAAVAA